jgi:dTDP-4-dehydrorhamnose 3,5-epimerase
MLQGIYLVHPEPKRDERGFFARAWCEKEFEDAGIRARWVQANLSRNPRKGTFRGLHWQVPPHEEAKLVRCTRGKIIDVVVDIRQDSPNYLRCDRFVLSAEEGTALFVPEGFAHGFLTLEDDTEVFYLVSAPHCPSAEKGLRWNDPAVRIELPFPPVFLSSKDASWPLLQQP